MPRYTPFMTHEVWKDVVGLEGRYEVSNLGRVRSLAFRGRGEAGLMRPSPNYSGYQVITLGAHRKQYRVHVLVLEAFVGPRPPGMQGCHNNGDRADNRLENLRWDTPKGNIADRRSFGGELNPRAKLTDAQRAEVIRRRLAGETAAALGREFGVSSVRVCQLVKQSVTT